MFFCHHFLLSDEIDFCILCIFSKAFYRSSMLYHSRLCRDMLVDHHSLLSDGLVSLYFFRLQTSLEPLPFILLRIIPSPWEVFIAKYTTPSREANLFYHPSWLSHTFLVWRMLPDHHSFLCEGDHASLLQSMEQ